MRGVFGRCSGSVWEVFGRYLGSIWEVFKVLLLLAFTRIFCINTKTCYFTCFAIFDQIFRPDFWRCLRLFREVFGRYLGGIREVFGGTKFEKK